MMPPPVTEPEGFAIHHRKGIVFVSLVVCLAGAFAAYRMPASVFPQTDFPRVVVLVDNGVMPADEMMATITRPIEEHLVTRCLPSRSPQAARTPRHGGLLATPYTATLLPQR